MAPRRLHAQAAGVAGQVAGRRAAGRRSPWAALSTPRRPGARRAPADAA